ncbi:MAG: hypothetical protein V4685_05675 [Bacteroidota bacterium]
MQTDLLEQNYYPLKLEFRIATFHNDFTATDSIGNVRGYAKQKLFKFKEHVQIFGDTSQAELKYEIRADKWLDFNTSYSFTDAAGKNLGRLVRKGWKTLWKAKYLIFDENNQQDLEINEKNAWVKVWDGLLSEIPLVGFFTGYIFNPAYTVKRPDGTVVCTLKKEPSFFGRKFTLSNEAMFEKGEEDRVLLSVMMMVLLERRRG